MHENKDHSADGNTEATESPRRLTARLSLFRRSLRPRVTPRDEEYLQLIHDFLRMVNGEWYWDVFVALQDGPLQYTDLLNAVRADTYQQLARAIPPSHPGRHVVPNSAASHRKGTHRARTSGTFSLHHNVLVDAAGPRTPDSHGSCR
ncbi:hypothetical protein GCM10018785_12060 [Streptomyces longispororuber]|uniref:Uncharacterized protein n=1 Tax=Streptomyces longispororuber TaxID=68230 RepID=A0A918ZC68_9ACTN|nr:hypothetical protein GCM10018785_12060 [Streptomyces longispororuber]